MSRDLWPKDHQLHQKRAYLKKRHRKNAEEAKYKWQAYRNRCLYSCLLTKQNWKLVSVWGTQQYFSHRHRRRPKSCLSTQTMFQMWRYGTFGTSTLGISKRKSGPIYISLFDLRQLFKEKREHPRLTELQLRGNPFKASQQFYKKSFSFCQSMP